MDELEARGDPLSLRAARYIRIQRVMRDGLDKAYRHLCQRSLEWERLASPQEAPK